MYNPFTKEGERVWMVLSGYSSRWCVVTGTIEHVHDDGACNESYTVAWDADSICKCPDALPTGRISADMLSSGPVFPFTRHDGQHFLRSY